MMMIARTCPDTNFVRYQGKELSRIFFRDIHVEVCAMTMTVGNDNIYCLLVVESLVVAELVNLLCRSW